MQKDTKSLITAGVLICVLGGIFLLLRNPRLITVTGSAIVKELTETPPVARTQPPLDTAAYDAKLLQIANLTIVTRVKTVKGTSTTPASTITTTSTSPVGWPVKTVYPDGGALLPFNRIVAYYGNLYSTQMGVLGEYPEPQMLAMLASTTAAWQAADPTTPVIPALDYIAISAQGSPGFDGDYRARMPDDQIQQIIQMATQIHGIVILDLQIR